MGIQFILAFVILVSRAQEVITGTENEYLGCHKDMVDRAMKNTELENNRMTIDLCRKYCGDLRYLYAGLQYGNQCFCGNKFARYGRLQEDYCNHRCTGNTELLCGGWWALSVYHSNYLGCYEDGVFTAEFDSTSMTIAKCQKFCNGFAFSILRYGMECVCGSNYNKTNILDDSKCQSKCSGDSNLICGGESAYSFYRTVISEYVGCYKNLNDSAMPNRLLTSTHMTVRKCQEHCKRFNFTYAGLQSAHACYCGNSYDSFGNGSESLCNMKCPADHMVCGGKHSLSVYRSVPSRYIGCYKDTTNRVMSKAYFRSNIMTVHICVNNCKLHGYKYAGLEAGAECYCGDSYDRYGMLGDNVCSLRCPGDNGVICGGMWALSLFHTGIL